VRPPRAPIAGVEAIDAALAAGKPVRVLLVDRDDTSPDVLSLVARAEARGAAIWRGGAGDLRRMSRGATAERAIAMAGADPRAADLDALCARGGAVWLLHRVAFPSNVGFAIRTAEVSGADGVVVDSPLNHQDRSRAAHVTMGADRMLPVLWESTEQTLLAARRHGKRVIAMEDVGDRAPWQVDLTGSIVLVIGAERDGIGEAVLSRCDAVVAVPMAGFVPSYNLQAALSAIAAERLRQLARHGGAA
jgi:23S rRNA (guanosine2251-2'-O)-methyltransferase